MKLKKGSIALLTLAGMFYMSVQKADACTRAVYIGPDHMVVTGRTMDWKEDIMSNIYVFPRGIQRAGYNKENAVKWTSKYGSVIATGYDIGTCDGMNEKGLVASLLFLPESVFDRPEDTRPVMGISIWTQYVLDNFATVHEAVEELKKESFRIDAPHMPNGSASTLHLAITDETGNTAVLEYLDGNLSIHEGKEFQVMTNSPRYDYQLAINDYWKEVGGLQMLPGTNRSSDRFVRASFYIHAIPQTPDAKIAVPSVLSVMRNVSVPFGITTPDKPHISSTRWRSVSDQKNKIYYFESVMTPTHVLSGGEKTRLALATLVTSRANVLLLDEPTNNLDPASREEILKAIAKYEGAIVLVTHDEGAVEALNPERVLLMPDGDEDLWNDSYLELVAEE